MRSGQSVAGRRSAGKGARGKARARSRTRVRTKNARAAALRAFAPRVLSLRMLPPRMRRRVAVVLGVCLSFACAFQFWLRDSPLVAVEDVTVTGLTTKDAPRVRAALASAAHTMTTLHVDHAELERAIAAYPVVRELDVQADFPHRLQIKVVEHRPAALVGGLPVAGDGTILRGLPVEGDLPKLDARGNLNGDRLSDPSALHAARVAGGAPAQLRARLERIDVRSEQGIVVELRDGPELIFGDARHLRAKWIAAVRILADSDAAGASYIDIRLPGRPAAGGLPAETVAPVAAAGSAELAPPAQPDPAAPSVDPASEQLGAPAATTPAPASDGTAQPTPEAPLPTDSSAGGGVSTPPG